MKGFTTRIVHSDRLQPIEHGSLQKPIHATVAYGYEDARDLAAAFQGTKGALIVCDLSREQTIQALDEWATNLYEVAGKVPVIFLGNKVDLVDSPDTTIIDTLVEKYSAYSYLTSAKTGANVDTAFANLGDEITKFL